MAEAVTKKEQSTDGYSTENKGENETKQLYKDMLERSRA